MENTRPIYEIQYYSNLQNISCVCIGLYLISCLFALTLNILYLKFNIKPHLMPYLCVCGCFLLAQTLLLSIFLSRIKYKYNNWIQNKMLLPKANNKKHLFIFYVLEFGILLLFMSIFIFIIVLLMNDTSHLFILMLSICLYAYLIIFLLSSIITIYLYIKRIFFIIYHRIIADASLELSSPNFLIKALQNTDMKREIMKSIIQFLILLLFSLIISNIIHIEILFSYTFDFEINFENNILFIILSIDSTINCLCLFMILPTNTNIKIYNKLCNKFHILCQICCNNLFDYERNELNIQYHIMNDNNNNNNNNSDMKHLKIKLSKKEFYNKYYMDKQDKKSQEKINKYGSFGELYKIERVKDQKIFALKKIEKSNKSMDEICEFYNEIQILSQLNHSNIISIINWSQTSKRLYIILQFISGKNLYEILLSSKNNKLNENITANIIKQIALGLQYIHSKTIVHRDIKLHNIMKTNVCDNNNFKIYIIDFGFANYCDIPLSQRCGTPQYVSPEVIDDNPSYGCKIDIWSLGVIMYVLLCGFLPFQPPNGDYNDLYGLYKLIRNGKFKYILPYWNDISNEAKDLINHLIVVNPNQRYCANDILSHKWIVKYSS